MQKLNVFWFRRDLRLFDNVGLFYALKDTLPVLPIFIFDKNILESLEDKYDARVSFIHDQVSKLNDILAESNSSLKVFHSDPEEAFQQLLKIYSIQAVYTNRDYEPYALERDEAIASLLTKKNIQFLTFKDQVIFERGEILNGQNEPYKVFTPYKNQWLQRLSKVQLHDHFSEEHFSNFFQMSQSEVPSLAAMGFKKSSIVVPDPDFNEKIIAHYAEKRDYPSVNGTSKLGVHFRFGTISIRHAVRFAKDKSGVWLSELIWREFYAMILAHFPHVAHRSFRPQYDRVQWINNEEHFYKWCNGMTGYPIVDAGMRELNATGYMHNRVRMVVASFLTKHLLIDWRWGETYFAQKLLDYDLASNNGGWQWAAGTGTDAQPYFRVFNPESQQKKFDPNLKYIKYWVPEYGTSDYPNPIVEHKMARARAIETYKLAVNP